MKAKLSFTFAWCLIIFGFDPANIIGAFMVGTNILIPNTKTKLSWHKGETIFVLTNSPWSFDHGLTMGHVIALAFDEEKEPGTFQHELAHVEQHSFLGPLYLPAHIITKVSCSNFSGPAWDCDFLEWGPYSTPPTPFRQEGSNIIVLQINRD